MWLDKKIMKRSLSVLYIPQSTHKLDENTAAYHTSRNRLVIQFFLYKTIIIITSCFH